jgi:biopolymer transport protein ExbB/TolQ
MSNIGLNDLSLTIIVLIVLSFYSLSFYLEKLYTVIRLARKNGDDLKKISSAVFGGPTAAGGGSEAAGGAVAALFGELISENNLALTKSARSLIFNYNIEADIAVEKLKVSISKLGSIAVLAPYIGLFGTVMGIIEAFAVIARTGSSNFAYVSKGISEALVATAAGLFLAIMASFFYNHLISKLKLIQSFKDCFIDRLENEFEERSLNE